MIDMEFSKKIILAVDERVAYYNAEVLPVVLNEYRLIHTCVKNLMDILVQKSIIKEDPYKLEKKISDVELVSNEPYPETERSLVIGTRISDYECILDFIDTYYKFSVENMDFPKIKKFVDFNGTFNWTSFTPNNPHTNTNGLATLLLEAKRGAPAMTVNMINDSVSKCSASIKAINAILKELNDFQKEVYKARVRKDIFEHPKFNREKADKSAADEKAEIKHTFPAAMNKVPYYTALIEEIAAEDQASNKETLQNALLNKLKIEKRSSEKKEKEIDTKEILLAAVHTFTALAPQLETVLSKLKENHLLLQNSNISFFTKLQRNFRKAFHIAEPPVIYTISITDSATGTVTREKIEFQEFIESLEKRISYYNSFSLRNSPGFKKIEKNPEEKILEFLNKQISDAQKLIVHINAFDTFFKTSAGADEKKAVKGMKMELTALRNTIINTNQHRANYTAVIEEQTQMKKLGIADAE